METLTNLKSNVKILTQMKRVFERAENEHVTFSCACNELINIDRDKMLTHFLKTAKTKTAPLILQKEYNHYCKSFKALENIDLRSLMLDYIERDMVNDYQPVLRIDDEATKDDLFNKETHTIASFFYISKTSKYLIKVSLHRREIVVNKENCMIFFITSEEVMKLEIKNKTNIIISNIRTTIKPAAAEDWLAEVNTRFMIQKGPLSDDDYVIFINYGYDSNTNDNIANIYVNKVNEEKSKKIFDLFLNKYGRDYNVCDIDQNEIKKCLKNMIL